MRKAKLILLIILGPIILPIVSCKQNNFGNDSKLFIAFELAGKNKAELLKVLDHYSNPSDSLKYKAAIFLIQYMPGKYGKAFLDYGIYKHVFDTLSLLNAQYEKKPRPLEFYRYYKFFKSSIVNKVLFDNVNINSSNYFIEKDIETITADYLIENIDYAFKAWNLPWAKHLSFYEFCEYILPYRYGHEQLQSWRKIYFESHIKLLKSLKNEKDPVKVCLFLNNIGKQSFSEITALSGLNNAIKPLDLIRINSSTSCADQSGLALLRMRGLGVPVTRLSTPYWGNWGSGHELNGVLNLYKKWICFQNEEELGGPGIYHFPSNLRPSKFYAELYGENIKSNSLGDGQENFRTLLNYIDVTGDVTKTTDVTLSFNNFPDNSVACLCTFNNNRWIPITKSIIKDNLTTFYQIGKNIIYQPGVLENGKLIITRNPFLADTNGRIREIKPVNKTQSVSLTRKFYPNSYILSKLYGLNHCYIQGSNDANFQKSTTLLQINRISTSYPIEQKLKNAEYKFVRLVIPYIDSLNESLAGLQFYDSRHKILKGEAISSTTASHTFYSAIFDGNNLTYVQIINRNRVEFPQFDDGINLIVPNNTPFWIGLKFESKKNISAVELTPRTDDNDVLKGETYKLFYWNKGWKIAGTKKAKRNRIEFIAPKNALLAMKNVSKGKENRIFLYQGNKQIWY